MAIISSDDLILEANLGKQTDPVILTPHIESAEMELMKILGNEKYSLIEGYQSSETETEKKIFSEVRKGAVYLAMSYAVHSLNIETQGSGIVKAKGWDQSRSELLSQNEVNDMSRYFRATAMLFLQPHIPAQDDNIDLGEFFLSAL